MPVTTQVTLTNDITATQWMDHGDYPSVARLDGHNWEHFPNESDKGCGLLYCAGMVYSGDWILHSKFFGSYRIVKPQEFEQMFKE